ncbi:MAG: hypothetical protein KDB14_14635 [Planctomycetales bacterium]|nr:hypothetical protein [Planctomycetales bacterium]
MGDLKNPRVIYLKGWLFLGCGLLSGGLLLARRWDWQDALLLAICVWACCRFYYFAFYVIEHYVDGDYRYAGLFDFLKRAWRRR